VRIIRIILIIMSAIFTTSMSAKAAAKVRTSSRGFRLSRARAPVGRSLDDDAPTNPPR
jgi:hypothetical protein